MDLVVQKYGGTSVANTERILQVAHRISKLKRSGARVVVVVSAMGDTTDELLKLARAIAPTPPARELDMLLTAGERISMALLSMALQKCGEAAISFTGSQSGIITNTQHSDAKILEVRATRILEALEAGWIVIVAGFQGVSAQREVTTLGRGGSDTTAVALAAALGALRCEICTDVDAVYSADPRYVPRAQPIPALPYDEMLQLAALGARVLHPRAVEVAMRFKVPLHVRSSFNDKKGTVIGPMETIETAVIRGITCDEDVATLSVHFEAGTNDSARLLRALGDAGICTRCVVQSGTPETGVELLCLLRRDDLENAERIVRQTESPRVATLGVDANVAAISLVGQGIHSHPEMVGRILEMLVREGIAFGSVASSAISMTCIVPRDQATSAMRALHNGLGLDDPADSPGRT